MPGESYAIEVDLKTPEQLYNSLDPSPFHERDLDEKAERFIVGWAREAKFSDRLQLIVTLPAQARTSLAAQRIPEAVQNHFRYRALQARQDLHELLRIGRQSLAIGVMMLLICFGVIRYVSLAFERSAFTGVMVESLLILGWVANWRPLEIFLYDWWPIRRQIILFHRLATMTVEVRDAPSVHSPAVL
jgi:hypothetical protein